MCRKFAMRRPTATLVTTGPLRFSRNPLYIASTLAYIGVVILTNALWLLVTLVPVLLIVHDGIVRGEEGSLETQFRDLYREYCARVRRYI
jgi:protein-S-isoprenylcysteine O-methyltransferase Ste14